MLKLDEKNDVRRNGYSPLIVCLCLKIQCVPQYYDGSLSGLEFSEIDGGRSIIAVEENAKQPHKSYSECVDVIW